MNILSNLWIFLIFFKVHRTQIIISPMQRGRVHAKRTLRTERNVCIYAIQLGNLLGKLKCNQAGSKLFAQFFRKLICVPKTKVEEREGETERGPHRKQSAARLRRKIYRRCELTNNTMHTRHTNRRPPLHSPTLQQSTRGDAYRLAAVVCVCVEAVRGSNSQPRENIIYSICDSSSLCPTCLIKIAV